MAIVEIRKDDIDGSTGENVKPVRFLSEGVEYEIDLSPENRSELETAVQKLIDAGARKVVSGSKASGGSKSGVDTTAVREWALERGMKVSERGRISAEVLEAYANRSK